MAALGTLVDRFDAYPSPYVWIVAGDAPAMDGDRFRLSDGRPSDSPSIETVSAYTFDYAQVSAEVVAGVQGRYFEMQVAALAEGGIPYAPQVSMQIYDDVITCTWSSFGGILDWGSTDFAYDADAMRYLRMSAEDVPGGGLRLAYLVRGDTGDWRELYAFTTGGGGDAGRLWQVRMYAAFGTVYLSDFNVVAESRLWQRQPDGSFANVGLPGRPVMLRAADGRILTVDGVGGTPVFMCMPDGTWRQVASRRAGP